MKKNSINWNHTAESLSEAFGLNKEQTEDVQNRVINTAKETETVSQAAARLIDVYEEDPAKLAYALVILEGGEKMAALQSIMTEEPEAVED